MYIDKNGKGEKVKMKITVNVMTNSPFKITTLHLLEHRAKALCDLANQIMELSAKDEDAQDSITAMVSNVEIESE